jgi:hypothetical protein
MVVVGGSNLAAAARYSHSGMREGERQELCTDETVAAAEKEGED